MVEVEKEVDDGEREIFAGDEGHGCDAFLFGSSQLRRRGEVEDWSGSLLVGRCSGVDGVCRRSG